MTAHSQVDSGLQAQIDAFRALGASKVPANPEAAVAYAKMIEALNHSNAAKDSLQVGMQAPDFSLPNVDGSIVTLASLLQSGSVVVTFYRGDWCPFCNFALRAYERILVQIKEAGASLIAISPQTPDYSILTAQNKALTYPVLSDVSNMTARRYGLVWKLPETMRPYSGHLTQYNGDDSLELPIPGTFVIDRSGKVTFTHVNPNYTQRLEPDTILTELHKLI